MGPQIRLVDPAYNTVLDLKKILEEKKLLKIDNDKKENYYTTGNPDNMKKVAKAIFNSFKYSIEKVKFQEFREEGCNWFTNNLFWDTIKLSIKQN